MADLHVIKPGMLTTVQDAGRWGFQAFGVSVAGPMDPFSFRAANAVVRNGLDAAALEITVVGPELEFEDDRLVAIAGGQFAVTVDGRQVDTATAFAVSAGSRLQFGDRLSGARAYLAVDGGVEAPRWLGSRATDTLAKMGGLDGRPLRAGDRLALGRPAGLGIRRPERLSPLLSSETPMLRVLPGPQADRFAEGSLQVLQSAPYRVRPASGRVGFRLDGQPIRHSRGADIISDATSMGSLQVPADGQPILLMADRQTTGGYPKIATVISADIGIAGQLAPGDDLSFRVCSPEEAITALIARERALLALEP